MLLPLLLPHTRNPTTDHPARILPAVLHVAMDSHQFISVCPDVPNSPLVYLQTFEIEYDRLSNLPIESADIPAVYRQIGTLSADKKPYLQIYLQRSL